MKEQIKDYFKRYPSHDEVFESGGVLFHESGAAESYGKGNVNRHTRSDVDNESEEQFGDNIDIVEADIDALDYATLKALAKLHELETEDIKKSTLLVALKELQEKLKQQ